MIDSAMVGSLVNGGDTVAAEPTEPRLCRGVTLLIATHNAGKLRVFTALLRPYDLCVVGAAARGIPEPEETGDDFGTNATLKARHGAVQSGLPSLADLWAVRCFLEGTPGVLSARWAGSARDFKRAIGRVLAALEGASDRSAALVCALALAWPDCPEVVTTEGRIDGHIVATPRGSGGFGYDSAFQPDGESETFAEMTDARKRNRDHRAAAFKALALSCFPLLSPDLESRS